jgi:hypothetical protein
MAQLAPTLSGPVAGRCPDCAADTPIDLDARELCFADLRFQAGGVREDVHLIASGYGWAEHDILALPTARRRRYADLVAGVRWTADALAELLYRRGLLDRLLDRANAGDFFASMRAADILLNQGRTDEARRVLKNQVVLARVFWPHYSKVFWPQFH